MLKLRIAALGALAGAVIAPAAPAASPPPLFPATVKDANGTVTIGARPQRIVSLSPTATEDLFAIGAGSQGVPRDGQSNYPASAPKPTLSGFRPNAEAIATYNPDLVVVTFDGGIVAALQKLNLKVLFQPPARNLADAYQQIGALGAATGHPKKAAAVVTSMQ